jgi:UDPglucose 6-dehydrogenase
MKIAVVGTGYVGLVTGTCLAEAGNQVICVDVDEAKVAKMKKGQVPIYEPGLDTVFERNIAENRLAFTTGLAGAVKDAEVIFLALPTPPNGDGSADLSYVMGVADDLGKLLDHYCVVVDKSTVPVGTAAKVTEAIAKTAKVPVDVVSNPEFLREGFAVNDFMKPDRVVIGTSSTKARAIMGELYDSFVDDPGQIIFMDERSAEMTKYAANSYLATKISFMNEIANLCELVGADVDAVRLGIGSDDRIGKRFLFAGVGYGGSCFPKDVTALYNIASDNDYDFKIIKAVKDVNDRQKQTITNKAKAYYGGRLDGKTFALWGLAFKPDTDDIREAPALAIIDELAKSGAAVVAYDPEATDNVRKLYAGSKSLSFADDMYGALAGADALIIATEWAEFRSPDYAKIKRQLKAPVIFDGRNLYNLEAMKKAGFYYQSVGRATVGQRG